LSDASARWLSLQWQTSSAAQQSHLQDCAVEVEMPTSFRATQRRTNGITESNARPHLSPAHADAHLSPLH
jgi:hypothetical protein